MKKKCPECSVLYPLKSLKHHIKTMHSTEIFKCEKCDYTTSEKGEIYLKPTLLGLIEDPFREVILFFGINVEFCK